MRKKFVKVALLSLVACGASSAFVACSDDDWKSPMTNVETSVEGINKTITQLDEQVKALDAKIAQNKSAADAAAKAAADALAAAQAAQTSAEDAKKYADEAAQKYAEEAAARAVAQAAEELKAQIEAVMELIKANQEAIATNSDKIQGNTDAIAEILAFINDPDGLKDTVAGINAALEVLEGKCEALGLDIKALDEAIKEELGTLEENMLAGDQALKDEIDDLKAQIEALNIGTSLEELAEYMAQTETQLLALKEFQERTEGKLSDMNDEIVLMNAELGKLTTALNDVKTKAEANAAKLVEQLALINANKADINTLKGQVAALEEWKTQLSQSLREMSGEVEAISMKLNGIESLLNTLAFDQLRGLVFVPETYVGGIESALSYHMNYKALTLRDVNTPADYLYKPALAADATVRTQYRVGAYKVWNIAPAADAKNLVYEPATIVKYHMNPKSAQILSFDDLELISNDAEIITRANGSDAKLALDPAYNDNKGFMTADGILSVALTGEAPLYSNDNKMPVFALQAKVMSPDNIDETGENKPEPNYVTSDYAMFVQMNVNPTAIEWNRSRYTDKFGSGALRGFTEVMPNENINNVLEASTTATVVYGGSLDLKKLMQIAYNDVQRGTPSAWINPEQWEGYGLNMNFQLVDYFTSQYNADGVCTVSETVSESSWATIADASAGVLEVKDDPNAIGHMPLVYVTVTHDKDVVLDGFVKIRITADEPFYTTDAITFNNIDFNCDEIVVGQPSKYLPYNMLLEATGLDAKVFANHYKPVYGGAPGDESFLQQYDKSGNEWIPVDGDDAMGIVHSNTLATAESYECNIYWEFTGARDKQLLYQQPDHTATRYICFEGDSEGFADVYVPLTITVNNKLEYTVGNKVEARWFRENNNTALLNVPQPTDGKQVTTINSDLNQLWINGENKNIPVFTPTPYNYENYKYYFTAENNRTVDGVTYKVVNKTNPDIVGVKSASNSNMGDLALMATAGIASEYNNVELYAGDVKIATLDQTTGYVTYNTDPAALVYLNKFSSMGGVDRPDAKLGAIVGIVPYSTCKVAYKLTNPTFDVAFLRPINVDPSKEFKFSDAQANGSPVNIYGMLSFSDWRNISFVGNEWYYGYYNVKKIYPVLNKMKTNIATINSDPTNFAPASQQLIEAFKYSHEGDVPVIDYEPNDISEDNNGYCITLLQDNLGTITYNNTDINVKAFKVQIPFVVEYELGQFEVYVTCNIGTTLGNE